MAKQPKVEKIYSMPQLAKKLGVHRTTLKRLEDRGIIPKARMIEFPFQGRAYTEEEAEVVRIALEQHLTERKPGDDGAYHVNAEKLP